MLLIWTGFGIVVPVIAVIAVFLVAMITSSPIGLAAAAVLAGAALWPIGRHMNAAGNRHSFFFIPVQYWAPLTAILGILAAFAGEA